MCICVTRSLYRAIQHVPQNHPEVSGNQWAWSGGGSVVLHSKNYPNSVVQVDNPLLIALNPLNAELNPICYLLALLGAHHFFHVSRIRVKSLTLRLLMSYIYIYIWSTYS